MGTRIALETSPTGVEHSIVLEDDHLYTVEHTPTRIESDILDSCAQMRSMAQRKGSAFQHAARIPILTYQIWKREWHKHRQEGGTLTWSQFEVMKLNSRDNCKLRTGLGSGVYGKKL